MSNNCKHKPHIYYFLIIGFIFFIFNSPVFAEQSQIPIPMYEKGASTYYVKGEISGSGNTEFLVDTGSGYVTINEITLKALKETGKAEYVKEILCILADGKEDIVSVYKLASIRLSDNCVLKNVEAAVFPGNTRQILGLSALKKAGGFNFSFEPPQLTLNTCA